MLTILVAAAPVQAQPGPPMGGPPMGRDGMGHMGMGPGGPADGGFHARRTERMEMFRAFGLLHRPDDRKLTPPDVQKIAEAFLLWHGNRTWKVTNVAPAGDVIAFDIATAEGSVIARFAMDPKTGRLTRRG